jgi:translocation and assembly module TamB
VESAQGALNLQARVEGTISQPRVSGLVSWSAGSIKLRVAGATYQLQPGKISLQGNRITVSNLTLQSEGTMTLTGDVTLSGPHPDEVRARVQINNFKAIDKLGSEAVINGAINLDGQWPKLALRGNVTIPNAHFRLSFLNLGPSNVNKDVVLVRQQNPEKPQTPKAKKARAKQESQVWKDLSVHLDVQAPNHVWIDDRLAKIEVAVNIAVRKQPGQELAYSGEVQALHGRVAIVGREFQVTRGVVNLPAIPGAEPTVNARIQYEANDVILYAQATGPVSNPKINLGGEPAISETDWMAYLLYGRPVASLSREEQGALSAAGAFGGLATRMILKDLLGLAPPITRGLTISYQQRNDPLYREDPYQVVINYRINRRFSVQSQVGGRNTGGDVLFNYDF